MQQQFASYKWLGEDTANHWFSRLCVKIERKFFWGGTIPNMAENKLFQGERKLPNIEEREREISVREAPWNRKCCSNWLLPNSFSIPPTSKRTDEEEDDTVKDVVWCIRGWVTQPECPNDAKVKGQDAPREKSRPKGLPIRIRGPTSPLTFV